MPAPAQQHPYSWQTGTAAATVFSFADRKLKLAASVLPLINYFPVSLCIILSYLYQFKGRFLFCPVKLNLITDPVRLLTWHSKLRRGSGWQRLCQLRPRVRSLASCEARAAATASAAGAAGAQTRFDAAPSQGLWGSQRTKLDRSSNPWPHHSTHIVFPGISSIPGFCYFNF